MENGMKKYKTKQDALTELFFAVADLPRNEILNLADLLAALNNGDPEVRRIIDLAPAEAAEAFRDYLTSSRASVKAPMA